jgi:hypothetical protein
MILDDFDISFFYVVFWWSERDWNIWSLAPGIHPISDSYQSWAQPFQATFTDRSQAFAPLGYVNTIYIYARICLDVTYSDYM